MGLAACSVQSSGGSTTGTVHIDPRAALASFVPDQALGAAVDGLPAGQIDDLYTPHNIAAMRSTGLRPISYSLRTELGIDAWHWGEEGTWSDPAHHQGYWTGSDNPVRPVLRGWGYALPRRGDSVDQAEDDGYSRIDDGDRATFWKSNPWLDAAQTHAPERPQWVVVQFDEAQTISAARIAWGAPYARAFRVQYWSGDDPYDEFQHWRDFPQGVIAQGRGGDGVLRLADRPIRTRLVRILLEVSSHTAPAGARDPRDAMGYAIAELGIGHIDAGGRFVDAMVHARDGSDQTQITVSSTDPWHRATDRDADAEQPGFDRLYRNGVTNGLPMVVPAGVLYDTPDNAAAALRFLRRRHYPVAGIEMGEEPDGQNISAEDFATLYRQFARALQAVDPHVRIGGPNLQDAVADSWADDTPDHSFTRRFLRAIRTPGRTAPLDFFSMEHYPYDSLCGKIPAMLRGATDRLDQAMARLRADGVPTGIPWIVTEYGISAFSGQAEVDMPGALFDVDLVAHFLAQGGHAAYLLGYGPDRLYEPGEACTGYGELMLFGADARHQAAWATPAFWGLSMLAHDWVVPGGGTHRIVRGTVDLPGGNADHAVVAWPVHRPDGTWAVLLVNRDEAHAHAVRIDLGGHAPGGAWHVVQYGARDYRWLAAGENSHPTRDDPPHRFDVAGGVVDLPAYSITVVGFAGG
ncbi:hypothetical protein AQZ49_09600 [Novosphingobium sp. FSW06-99]|nr:hypothetical protein AQZ49_09600 [Novosphingobium sp. FSW06-99]